MTYRAIQPAALCSFMIALLTARVGNAEWVHPPSDLQLQQTPGLVHETFDSDSMNARVGYSVVLPPSYEQGERRYPVVYWLHGGGGNECSSLFTAKAWSELYKTQRIREVILVYPNGARSGYMDHADGQTLVESMIIRELIPRIDDRFRTIPDRTRRAAHGFSMGASGSIKFAIKYPDLFCSVVAYGGGAIDLERDTSPFIRNILERNLRSEPQRIRDNNSYFHLERNQDQLRRNRLRFLLICGEQDTWKESAVSFQAALKSKGLACSLTLVPETGHDIRKLIEAQGAAAAIFQDVDFR